MNWRWPWQRSATGAAVSRHRRLAEAIERVGPLSPEPGMGRFIASAPVTDGGVPVVLSVVVPDESHEPRWLDVTRDEGGAFLHHRFVLQAQAVQALWLGGAVDTTGQAIDLPIDGESPAAQRAWRLFDHGVALVNAHCEARDAAHAAWRERLDRAAALQVIGTLFGPWDAALRAATRTFERYAGPQPPNPPRDAAALDAWLWLHVVAQGQRSGRPLVEFLVTDDGAWVADRCREQKEPAWAREFQPHVERRLDAERVGDAFAAFLSGRDWALVMVGAELGKPLPAAEAEALVSLARRAGFADLALRAAGPFSPPAAAGTPRAPRSRGPRPPGPSSRRSSPSR